MVGAHDVRKSFVPGKPVHPCKPGKLPEKKCPSEQRIPVVPRNSKEFLTNRLLSASSPDPYQGSGNPRVSTKWQPGPLTPCRLHPRSRVLQRLSVSQPEGWTYLQFKKRTLVRYEMEGCHAVRYRTTIEIISYKFIMINVVESMMHGSAPHRNGSI